MIVYQFPSDTYKRDFIESLSQYDCKSLKSKDPYIQVFEADMDDLLNDNLLDTDNNWFRTFIK